MPFHNESISQLQMNFEVPDYKRNINKQDGQNLTPKSQRVIEIYDEDERTDCLIVKKYLRIKPNPKIRICIIGSKSSGKTSLIKSYLKYKNDMYQRLL